VVRKHSAQATARRPFSLRLADDGIRSLQEEAARYRVAPRTLAQELLEEGLRMRRYPAIAFADRGGRRRAVFARFPRLRVAQAIETARASASLAEAGDYLAVPVADLEQAIDYYRAHRDEIDRELDLDRTESERAEEAWRARSTFATR